MSWMSWMSWMTWGGSCDHFVVMHSFVDCCSEILSIATSLHTYILAYLHTCILNSNVISLNFIHLFIMSAHWLLLQFKFHLHRVYIHNLSSHVILQLLHMFDSLFSCSSVFDFISMIFDFAFSRFSWIKTLCPCVLLIIASNASFCIHRIDCYLWIRLCNYSCNRDIA
jgi:hypothetical protein